MKMKFKYMIGMSLVLILTVWVFTARTAAAETVTIGGVEYERDGWGVKEPESDIQIESAHLADFGVFSTESYPAKKTSYRLMEGTELEAEVVRIASPDEGPTVYVVSGIHGDERAGFNGMAGMLAMYQSDKWPVVTAFRCYYHPDTDLALKPTTVKNVIAFFELEGLRYTPHPVFDFYDRYRAAVNEMRAKLSPLCGPTGAHFSGFLMMAMEGSI